MIKQFNLALVHFLVYTQPNIKAVLFQTTQFSISTQFKCQTSILPIDRTHQVLLLQIRVVLGVIAMKGYSAFPKLQHYWSLTIGLFSVIYRTLVKKVLILYRNAVGVFCSPGPFFSEELLYIDPRPSCQSRDAPV